MNGISTMATKTNKVEQYVNNIARSAMRLKKNAYAGTLKQEIAHLLNAVNGLQIQLDKKEG